MTLKAISIRQPWAWLIVNGFKDIENRDWSAKHRGRILIHAGLRQDYSAYEGDAAYRRLNSKIREIIGRDSIFDWETTIDVGLGAIVGEVTIADCVTESPSPWFTGAYGFVLTNPVAYETPIPYKGQVKIFTVPDHIIEEANRGD